MQALGGTRGDQLDLPKGSTARARLGRRLQHDGRLALILPSKRKRFAGPALYRAMILRNASCRRLNARLS
jgi:hypothetical protein